jgi:hypothetical protein
MIPVQVWLFDQKTGRVLKRISTETIAAEKEENRRAIAAEKEENRRAIAAAIAAKQEQRRRVFPLVIDVAASVGIFDITIDGDEEHRIRLFPSSQRRIFDASSEIVIKCLFERYSDALNVKVNGLPHQPNWKKDADGNLIDLITMRQTMDQK